MQVSVSARYGGLSCWSVWFWPVTSMSIFGFLKRNKAPQKSSLPPIRTIRRPGEVRAKNQARLAREFEESGAYMARQKADDEFMDTGELALQDDNAENADPYSTHSWQMDPEEGIRRVEDQSLVNRERKKKVVTTSDNPYDSSVMKKGW